ncbi:hypothetical protein BGX20_007160, partial [Mortierella sp. AD010]
NDRSARLQGYDGKDGEDSDDDGDGDGDGDVDEVTDEEDEGDEGDDGTYGKAISSNADTLANDKGKGRATPDVGISSKKRNIAILVDVGEGCSHRQQGQSCKDTLTPSPGDWNYREARVPNWGTTISTLSEEQSQDSGKKKSRLNSDAVNRALDVLSKQREEQSEARKKEMEAITDGLRRNVESVANLTEQLSELTKALNKFVEQNGSHHK